MGMVTSLVESHPVKLTDSVHLTSCKRLDSQMARSQLSRYEFPRATKTPKYMAKNFSPRLIHVKMYPKPANSLKYQNQKESDGSKK